MTRIKTTSSPSMRSPPAWPAAWVADPKAAAPLCEVLVATVAASEIAGQVGIGAASVTVDLAAIEANAIVEIAEEATAEIEAHAVIEAAAISAEALLAGRGDDLAAEIAAAARVDGAAADLAATAEEARGAVPIPRPQPRRAITIVPHQRPKQA